MLNHLIDFRKVKIR